MNDFRLPENLRESGDPIEGNPFQSSDARHKVWADATRSAETELCDLNSLFVKSVPTDPAAFASWLIDLAAGKFDIWAKRHIHVIRSDSEVRAFDQWLFNYAQSWLEELPKGLDRAAIEWNPPAPVDVTTLRVNLRLRLIERIEHWKGEARRYVVEQKAHEERVEAGLLGVHSKRLEGAKLVDCLREAYDVFASPYARAGQQLTEKLLNQTIPSLVFGAAIQHKWIPYPLVRSLGCRVVANFLEGWYDRSRSRFVAVPEQELTETFGGYKVTEGYEAKFRRILEGRIAFWQAEALRRAAAGSLPRAGEGSEAAVSRGEAMASQPETADQKEAASRIAGEAQPAQGEPASVHAQQPESSGGGASSRQETATEAVTTKAPTERHRTRRARRKKAAKRKAGKQGPKTNREKVNDFIARMAAAGEKITKKDIWTVAGYKDRTEFQRFQRNDKSTTRSATRNFNRVLAMQPETFIDILDMARARTPA